MQIDPALSERPRYKHSGRVGLFHFPLLCSLALGVSVGLAVVLHWLYTIGHYYTGLCVIVFALIPSGLMMLSVRFGRCRNPWLAGAIGLVSGLIMYLGYYYCDLFMAGISNLQYLPEYIGWRMRNDIIGDPSMPTSRQVNGTVDIVFNWGFFIFELVVAIFLPAAAGWVWSRKPFCETCSRWMKQRVIVLPGGSGSTLLDDLCEGSVQHIAAGSDRDPGQAAHTAVAIEYCLSTGYCPVYLSIKEIRRGGASPLFRFDGTMGRTLLRRIELADEEIAPLALGKPELTEGIETPDPHRHTT